MTNLKRFSPNNIYKTIQDAAHKPKALWICCLISFCESSFFPIPPDVMMIPMILAHRAIAFRLALFATIASVLGGFVGYYIGYALFSTVGQWIVEKYGLHNALLNFQNDFAQYGFWIIAVKGLIPIPFKIVTIASGIAQFNLIEFTIASIIARASRFTLLSYLLWRVGPVAKPFLEKHMKWVMILTMCGIVLGFVIVKYIYD
jgi:membrane protein YqaA with SNARE-associated domain